MNAVLGKTYEDGLRDGELKSLKQEITELKDIVAELSKDVRAQGKIIWMLSGALVLAQFVIPLVTHIV